MADVNDWQDVTDNNVTDDWEDITQGQPLPSSDEPVSLSESAARGAAQGISFGFADELQAKTEELLAGADYDKRIKEIRASYKAAADENPITYHGSDILSSFLLPIGGLGAAAKGGSMAARLRKTAAAGATMGALAGTGTSEGEEVADVIKDASLGATAGAIMGPALEGSVGIIKNLTTGTPKKIGAIADVRDFYKYGREGIDLSGPEASRAVTRSGFETVESELIPELEKTIKVKNAQYEAGKKAAEAEGRVVDIQQLEDLVNKAESVGVEPKQIEKLRRELSILGKKKEVEVTNPSEYQTLYREKLSTESQKLKDRAYEIQLSNAEKSAKVAAKEADRQNKEMIKLVQAELKAINPAASNKELLELASEKLKGKLKNPEKAAEEARLKSLAEARDAFEGQTSFVEKITGEDLTVASTGKNKRTITPTVYGESGDIVSNVTKVAAADIEKAADKNAAYAYALAERENNKAVQDLAKVYGQQQMSMSRDNIVAELKTQGKWIDPTQAAQKAKLETRISGKPIDVSTSFSPELGKDVLTASSGDEELVRKILPNFKFTKQEYQNPNMGVRDVEAFRNFISGLTAKDPLIDFRSTQELNKLSGEVKDTYNKLLGDEVAKTAMSTDKSVRKSLAELGVDSLITDSGIENKVNLRDKLSKLMATANTAKGASESVKVENAFNGLKEVYKNDPVKLNEVTAAFDQVKDKMRQAYLADITTGHNTFAIDPTSINWTMTAAGKLGLVANQSGRFINQIANSSTGQMMGQAKRFLDKGYKSYSAAFEKMAMQTPEKRRAMMYVLLQQPEFREAFGKDLTGLNDSE